MESLWPNILVAKGCASARAILLQQARYLDAATCGAVIARMTEPECGWLLMGGGRAAVFDYVLKSIGVKEFEYKPFTVGVPLTQYPVKISVEDELALELDIQKVDGMHVLLASSEDDFVEFLRKAFVSEKMRSVILSLVKMSEKSLL